MGAGRAAARRGAGDARPGPLLSTAVAYTIYFRLLATAGATNLMLVTLLVPVSALILAALFLGESLTWPNLAGVVLIALGLAAIDGWLIAAARPATRAFRTTAG